MRVYQSLIKHFDNVGTSAKERWTGFPVKVDFLGAVNSGLMVGRERWTNRFLRSNRFAFLSNALALDLHFFHALRLAAASSDVIKLSLPMGFSTVVVSPIPSISKADSRNNLSYAASSARRFAQYSSYSRGWLTLCMVRLTTKTENVMKIIAEGQFFFKKLIGWSDNSGWEREISTLPLRVRLALVRLIVNDYQSI